MEISLEDLQLLLEVIKEHDGEFTKEELWEEYKKNENKKK